jgi:hypothetical protein
MSTNPVARRSRTNQVVRRLLPFRYAAIFTMALVVVRFAFANGGPFIVKYPGGDTSAKGVLARLDPDLRPARESRLEVVKEDLSIDFTPPLFDSGGPQDSPPIVSITAEYLIRNPTARPIEIEFGFPILRGVFISPLAMTPTPDVQVRMDKTEHLRPILISNSALLGLLRRRAGAVIERSVRDDERLRSLARSVWEAGPSGRAPSRRRLASYLSNVRRWSGSDASLFVEYVSLEKASSRTPERPAPFYMGLTDSSIANAAQEFSWAASAIGELKATQWLARLAGRLDPAFENSYEAVFESWGGDVRELSVDLETRRIRPREVDVQRRPSRSSALQPSLLDSDSTTYARVDYLSTKKKMSRIENDSWNAVLKNLPVVFTFAPMNLLYYRASFPAYGVRMVTVSYKQHAYLDTREPLSYQAAYVLHPASFWDSFGPIRLHVTVPDGVSPVAGRDMLSGFSRADSSASRRPHSNVKWSAYASTVSRKTGELIIGISHADWTQAMRRLTDARRGRVQAGARR